MEPRTKYIAVGGVVIGLLVLALVLPPYLERRRAQKKREAEIKQVQDFQKKLDYTIDTRVAVKDVIEQPNFPVPSNLTLPTYFKYKQSLLTDPRNQAQCGSCYAFAVLSAFADRLSIRTGGKFRQDMAVQEIMSCTKASLNPAPTWNPCRGGQPKLVWDYIVAKGLPLETEFPYEGNTSVKGVTKPCKSIKRRFFGQDGSVVVIWANLLNKPRDYYERARTQIKTEIFVNGPVAATMDTHDDFYRYDGNSIYRVSKGAKVKSAHAIEIIGWCDAGVGTRVKGFENDGYWICKNSWGKVWPPNLPPTDSGYFYIGYDEARVEQQITAAKPQLDMDLLKLARGVKPSDMAYISYDKTVNDPEREALFNAIAKREQQGRRCKCPRGNYVKETCTPSRAALCVPCKRTDCANKKTIYTVTQDAALIKKICDDPKNPKYLKEQLDPCWANGY